MSNSTEKRTPYFEIDCNVVKKNYTKYIKSIQLCGRNDIVAYSIKANYDKRILRTLHNTGAYFEVCSEYEYNLLMKYGISAEKIIFNGVSVTDATMMKYIRNSFLFIIDSKQQLNYLIENKKIVEIGIRLNLDYLKQDETVYRNKESRFGIDCSLEELKKVVANNEEIRIKCLQCHFSGNTRSPLVYKQITKELCRIIREYCLNDVSFIDIGGGYKIADDYWTQADYVCAISEVLNEVNMERLQVIYEPGNSIVRTACSYYTRVIGIKEMPTSKCILVDGTKLHLSQTNKNMKWKVLRENTKEREVHKKNIVGCTCKESDVFFSMRNAMEFMVGDIICFFEVGAYTINSISQFILDKPKIYYR